MCYLNNESEELYMDSIITLIAFFVIIMILGWLLPYLLPILLIFGRKHVHIHTYDNSQSDNSYYQEQPKSNPKHDAIDVEYTEHDDGDTE